MTKSFDVTTLELTTFEMGLIYHALNAYLDATRRQRAKYEVGSTLYNAFDGNMNDLKSLIDKVTL